MKSVVIDVHRMVVRVIVLAATPNEIVVSAVVLA